MSSADAAAARTPPPAGTASDSADREAPPRGLLSAGDLAYLAYPVVPLPILRSAARARGLIGGWLRTRAWRVARDNIRAVLGDSAGPPEQLARRFLVNQQLQKLLVMLAPKLRPDDLERALPMAGLEHLDRALAGGTGAVILASHLNSVSMFVAAIVLRRRGYDVGIALPAPTPWGKTHLRAAYDRVRGIAPLKRLMGGFYAQFNVRPLLARLRRNTAIVMIGDGWHAAAFVDVDFLGLRLPFPTGPMSVARAAGAPVVPAFAVGEPATGLRFMLRAPLVVPRTSHAGQDVTGAIAAWARQLEAEVLAYPASWQHWEAEDMLGTVRALRRQLLADRYRL